MLLHSQWLDISPQPCQSNPPTPARATLARSRDWGCWVQFYFMSSLFGLTVHLSMGFLTQQSINTRNPRSTKAVLAGCLSFDWIPVSQTKAGWWGCTPGSGGRMEIASITREDRRPLPFVGSLWHHRSPRMCLLKRKTDISETFIFQNESKFVSILRELCKAGLSHASLVSTPLG